jgi:hypothetical protein
MAELPAPAEGVQLSAVAAELMLPAKFAPIKR